LTIFVMRPHRTQPHDRSVRDSTAKRIVSEARRHFFDHGFRRITMDDLADGLAMSKKTLYARFPSKDALVEAVLLDKFRDIERDLRRITSASSDVPAALHQLLACVQRHSEEIRPPFVRDIQREAPDMFKLVERRRRTIIQRHFGKLFAAGRKAGVIRTDIPTAHVIEILLTAVQGILNPSKMAELGLTPKTGFSTIIRVILDGVIAQPRLSRRR
jgi:AcrR family transcriptional regulator